MELTACPSPILSLLTFGSTKINFGVGRLLPLLPVKPLPQGRPRYPTALANQARSRLVKTRRSVSCQVACKVGRDLIKEAATSLGSWLGLGVEKTRYEGRKTQGT